MAEARDTIANNTYCIILKTDSETWKEKGLNAIAGGIWMCKDSVDQKNNDTNFITLHSTIDASDNIKTTNDNVRKITDTEFQFLVAIPPELRLDLLESPIFPDLLNIKMYDKVTVNLGHQEEHDCIVHYIGPLESKRGYYFGVVFETEVGDSDGSTDDKIYFVSKSNHGKFVTIDRITNISKSKIQKMTNMLSANSMEDLTASSGPQNIPLKRRTKSQMLLLDLALPVEPNNNENDKNDQRLDRSPPSIKKTRIVRLTKVPKKKEDTAKKMDEKYGLSINGRVVFFEESGFPMHGTIRFIGSISKLEDTVYVGVELDKRITDPDGNYKNGFKIFDCPRNKGIIARPEELIKDEDFKLMVKEKKTMGKIIVDEPFYDAGDLDENQNEIPKKQTKKKRTKSSVGEEHFSCPICLDTVEEAVETTCCHQIFCEPCLRKHREASCPKCRKKPYTVRISHFVRKLVGNFNVECSNEGCFEIVTRSDLNYHKEKCQYELVRCMNDGCKTRVTREKLEDHSRTCGFTLITCQNKGCLLRVARQHMTEHYKICDHAEVTCTNDGCDEKMIRMKLTEHQRENCKFMIVNCPVPNCKFKGAGTKLGEHLGQVHYELFIRHLGAMKEIYSKDAQVGIYTVKWTSPK